MAVDAAIKRKYTPTIGIETHVQLKTRTKLFSAVNNDARSAPPNSLISHIDAGLPGALPVLNKGAVDLCSLAAFALNTKPQKFSRFDRKHYFYPDLPKGYQITQYEQPIISGGFVQLAGGKKIGIERANLEEDAGKNVHPEGTSYTLVDLNRAGTPLLEIVSYPEIESALEAKAFCRELWLSMKYAGVTDGDLYHGHVRFDVNVSVSTDIGKKGTRSETKNLNSFRSVENAVNYEIDRQIELLEKDHKIVQETRGWDEAKQRTFSQRTKEEAEDYRYMPEPDIPPVELSDRYIEDVRRRLSSLPAQIREQLATLNITPQVIEDILDRHSIVMPILSVLDIAGASDARRAAFWLLGTQPADSTTAGMVEPTIEPERLIALSKMVESGKLSSSAGKTVFSELLSSKDDPQAIVERLKLLQLEDKEELDQIVKDVLAKNPRVVADIKGGQEKAVGFLVGQVMAISQGKANPAQAQELIRKNLETL
jgi:aspartyl-tRNA(Asn)/glutamyl-tRNA(Gln) amidotransferase subunit B